MILTDIESKIKSKYKEKENLVNVITSVLSKLNPLEILKSGYSLVEKDGKKVSSIKDLKEKDVIEINFQDGKLDAIINSVKK